MSAVVRELGVVLGGAALAGMLAGSLAQWVVLRTITLGYVDDLTTPALVAAISPDWWCWRCSRPRSSGSSRSSAPR